MLEELKQKVYEANMLLPKRLAKCCVLLSSNTAAICASMATVMSTRPSPIPALAETASTPRSAARGIAHGR